LQPKRHGSQDYQFQRLFAAGEVYISAIIDTLTAQAYYNPHIVTILQQILVGKSEVNKSLFERELEKLYGDKIQQGNIWQIPVPEEMVNKSFEKLFSFLLDRQLLTLGLYRLPGANDNKYPYVYSNPDPKLPITMRDRVFVLGKNIPRDLIIDYNLDGDVLESLGDKSGLGAHTVRNVNARQDFYGHKQSLDKQGRESHQECEFSGENSPLVHQKSIGENDPLVKDSMNHMRMGGLSGLMQTEEYTKEPEKETLSSIEFMKRVVEVLDARVDKIDQQVKNNVRMLEN